MLVAQMLCVLLMAWMLLCIVYGTDVIMPISCNILLHWCYCALFMAKMLLNHFFLFVFFVHFVEPLFHFQFWDAEWYIIPDNILYIIPYYYPIIYYPIECGIIHSYVHWLFDCSGQAVVFSSNYFEILYGCFMATHVLMLEYWWWGLQVFLVSFPKCSPWMTNVLFTTVNAPTGVAIYHTVLTGDSVFILRWH